MNFIFIKTGRLFLLFLILSLLAPSPLFAESEFEKWKKQELGEFKEFRDERDKAFTDFLKKQWEEFQLFKGEKMYEKPKPAKIPPAPPIPPAEIIPFKGKIVKEVTLPQPQPEEKPAPFIGRVPEPLAAPAVAKKPLPPMPPIAKEEGKAVSFDFYGNKVEIAYDPRIRSSLGRKIDNNTISSFWEDLSQARYEELVARLKRHRKEFNLNDWGYHLLVYKTGEAIYGGSSLNDLNTFVWFMLTKSGYEAKIGYDSDNIFLLIPSKNTLYGISYLTLDGRKFYALSFDGKGRKMGALFTYKGNYPRADELMDYRIEATPEIERMLNKRVLTFNYGARKYEIAVEYNKTMVDYFEFYPQTNFEVYFDASISPEAGYSLINALKPVVEGRTEGEAVNMIMRFVQTAFAYKTDDGQFGREKYMLPEETLFYPYSDCEDRSILFAYLVRNIVGLEVVALHYPNHIATAVRFNDEIKGDYIVYEGSKYMISDPTYVNADIGMAMPKFKGVQPKVIRIGRKT